MEWIETEGTSEYLIRADEIAALAFKKAVQEDSAKLTIHLRSGATIIVTDNEAESLWKNFQSNARSTLS